MVNQQFAMTSQKRDESTIVTQITEKRPCLWLHKARNVSNVSDYYLPKVRTNYGKFKTRFQAPMIWNGINEQVKTGSLSKFKLSLKEQYLSLY